MTSPDAGGLFTRRKNISERGAGQIIDLTHLAAMTRAEEVMSELADGPAGPSFTTATTWGRDSRA